MKERINYQEFIELTREPILSNDLVKILGYASRQSLNSVICSMRKAGHTIWNINSDTKTHMVMYIDGPEIKAPLYRQMEEILRNQCDDWYSRNELAALFNTDTGTVSACLCAIKRTGANVEARLNEKGLREYRVNEFSTCNATEL